VHPVEVPWVFIYSPQALALAVVFGAVIPRVWPPLIDRDGSIGEALLWAVTLPLTAIAASLLATAALTSRWRRSALSRAFAAAEATTPHALDEGGDATLVGVARRAPTSAQGSDAPRLGWVRRVKADPPRLLGANAWSLSAAGPFELVRDDGSVVSVRAGPWRVHDPFDVWVDAGRWTLVEGDRVRVRGRVELSIEPAAEGNYRASGRRRELAPDGGLIAPVGPPTQAPEALSRSVSVPWAALVVMLVHAGLRLAQPAPVHTEVALGQRCDARHLCAARSRCEVRDNGGRATCYRSCSSDADCAVGSRCDGDGRCVIARGRRP